MKQFTFQYVSILISGMDQEQQQAMHLHSNMFLF